MIHPTVPFVTPNVLPNESMIAALAQLPKGTQVTITVAAEALAAGLRAANGGPEYAEASEVARLVGFSAKYWVVRARAGKIPGANQEGSRGRWLLPVEACRAYVRGRGGRKPATVPFTPVIVRGKPRVPKAHREATA